MNTLSTVEGIVTADELAATVDAIAGVQLPDGNIPWIPGHHTDPWNLVEAAMALDVGGRHVEAERAYEWLRTRQRIDGSWHAYYVGDDVKDPTLDTNVTCYVANGAWHHYLSTRDRSFLDDFWPVVERAIDYTLDYQMETGEIAWRGDDPDDGALLTGSSSLHASLRCAIAVAEHLGHERPPPLHRDRDAGARYRIGVAGEEQPAAAHHPLDAAHEAATAASGVHGLRHLNA